MTGLLYGIVLSGEDAGPLPRTLPAGVAGAPVRLIEDGGLAAVVSTLDPADLTPTVAHLLSYARVVEILHAERAILPMRYGCLLGGEAHAFELLRVHGPEYATLLRGVDGCVEMGLRVLLPGEPPVTRSLPGSAATSGRGYLVERAARYSREEQAVRALTAVTERVREALGGLAERATTDAGGAGTGRRLGSLCFLVRRGSVEAFRRVFRQLERGESVQLLLSGPWPPYSFVTPGRPAPPSG